MACKCWRVEASLMDGYRVRDEEKGKFHPDGLTEEDCKPIITCG